MICLSEFTQFWNGMKQQTYILIVIYELQKFTKYFSLALIKIILIKEKVHPKIQNT